MKVAGARDAAGHRRYRTLMAFATAEGPGPPSDQDVLERMLRRHSEDCRDFLADPWAYGRDEDSRLDSCNNSRYSTQVITAFEGSN
jgi:hypothetical protein